MCCTAISGMHSATTRSSQRRAQAPTGLAREHGHLNAMPVGRSWATIPTSVLRAVATCANRMGSFEKIEAPGAGTGLFQGTYAEDINDAGQVVGVRYGTNTVAFLRSPSGTITEFNAPGAGNGKGQGTAALRINSGGMIIGQYTDAHNVSHAFLMY